MREDFTHFFEKKQFYAWDSSVASYSMAWEAWIESRVTFFEALWLMLPAWAYPRGLTQRFRAYKKISAKRLCLFYLESDGSLYISGKRFTVPDEDYEKLIHAMREIIARKGNADMGSVLEKISLVPYEAGF